MCKWYSITISRGVSLLSDSINSKIWDINHWVAREAHASHPNGDWLRAVMVVVNMGWIENTPVRFISTLGIHCCTNFWLDFPYHFNLHESRVVNIDRMWKWSFEKIKFELIFIWKIFNDRWERGTPVIWNGAWK